MLLLLVEPHVAVSQQRHLLLAAPWTQTAASAFAVCQAARESLGAAVFYHPRASLHHHKAPGAAGSLCISATASAALPLSCYSVQWLRGVFQCDFNISCILMCAGSHRADRDTACIMQPAQSSPTMQVKGGCLGKESGTACLNPNRSYVRCTVPYEVYLIKYIYKKQNPN